MFNNRKSSFIQTQGRTIARKEVRAILEQFFFFVPKKNKLTTNFFLPKMLRCGRVNGQLQPRHWLLMTENRTEFGIFTWPQLVHSSFARWS